MQQSNNDASARTVSGLVLGLGIGFGVAFLAIYAIEALGNRLYPVPGNLDLSNPHELRGHVATLPFGALLFVPLAWIVGTFAGGMVGSLVSRAWTRAICTAVGVVVLGGAIATLLTIPHPLWVTVAGVIGVSFAAACAQWGMARRPA